MQIPTPLLNSLAKARGFDEAGFLEAHHSGDTITSIRVNPSKSGKWMEGFPVNKPVPWTELGYYLSQRPSFTFDPLFHAGCYYVQEASSMFLEQALKQSLDLSGSLRVLDLCASPGGKSTHIQSLITRESLLVSNEVIKTRTGPLIQNIIKWGAANVVVTNNDAQDFARLDNYFDCLVVDAPCSGSGLFRRDPEAIKEWSEEHVNLCSLRQQRILGDAWPALKKNGILIYSTCSYSLKENEEVLDWLGEKFSLSPVPLKISGEWNIVETYSEKFNFPGYRFYPGKSMGEGFFLAVLQKMEEKGGGYTKPRKSFRDKISTRERELIKPWIREDDGMGFYQHGQRILVLPQSLLEEIPVLQSHLYLKKAGICLGELTARELIPDHELAQSELVSNSCASLTLDENTAIAYLRKEDLVCTSDHRGWALARYRDQNLGWVKILQNRINNYYPKEMRITKR